jgi:hypothetical protein
MSLLKWVQNNDLNSNEYCVRTMRYQISNRVRTCTYLSSNFNCNAACNVGEAN